MIHKCKCNSCTKRRKRTRRPYNPIDNNGLYVVAGVIMLSLFRDIGPSNILQMLDAIDKRDKDKKPESRNYEIVVTQGNKTTFNQPEV